MISDELHETEQGATSIPGHRGMQLYWICLVHDQNLVVDVDGKIVCLDNDVVLGIQVRRECHSRCTAWIGLIFFDFLPVPDETGGS